MKIKYCAVRAFLWSAAYYILIIALAAYLCPDAPLTGRQAAVMILPLLPLAGSCEVFFNKKIALHAPRMRVWAGADCGAKCVAFIFFALACPAVITLGVGAGAAITAAIFSFACEAVMFLKAKKRV